jgi:hypothetical protein
MRLERLEQIKQAQIKKDVLRETELQNTMKGVDLSKICSERDKMLKQKYDSLGLSEKAIEYRVY